jgi:hypothetical protein
VDSDHLFRDFLQFPAFLSRLRYPSPFPPSCRIVPTVRFGGNSVDAGKGLEKFPSEQPTVEVIASDAVDWVPETILSPERLYMRLIKSSLAGLVLAGILAMMPAAAFAHGGGGGGGGGHGGGGGGHGFGGGGGGHGFAGEGGGHAFVGGGHGFSGGHTFGGFTGRGSDIQITPTTYGSLPSGTHCVDENEVNEARLQDRSRPEY